MRTKMDEEDGRSNFDGASFFFVAAAAAAF
jgi:hypothetical protein